jgi:hypothetical protein
MGHAAAAWTFVAIMAGSQVYAGYQKKQAGKAQQYEYEAQARQERMAARDREIERRQRLLKSLAKASVQFGAQGTTFEGSPSALLLNDFREFELENTTAAAQNAATQSALNAAGKNYARLGRIGFVGGILEAAGTVAGGPWLAKKPPTTISSTTTTLPQPGVRMS